jgi:hypothetical protein
MFNIDFNKLITWLIPAPLRKEIFFAWMQVLCSPVIQLYGEFMAKRSADLYTLDHNGRVFSLEAVLNDAFDSSDRSIYITDGFTKSRLYAYTRAEEKPLYLNPDVPMYNRADYADTGIDFIVWVPTAVPLSAQQLIQLNSLVIKYKLAGKRFKVYRITI